MTNGTPEATLEYEPVYIAEDLILIPLKKVPTKPTVPESSPYIQTEKKSIIINIETLGLKPWKERIISIGLQDPLKPDNAPTVIMLHNEKDMLNALFTIVKDGGYDQVIGYGYSFDIRYIVMRAMKYNIPCKEFVDMDIYDLGQAMAQVKMEFMYFAQRQPKLSDIADFFWSYPKPFSDVEMMKYYTLGQFDKVLEFTSSQITRILLLYYLFKSIVDNPIQIGSSGTSAETLSSKSTIVSTPASKLTFPEANAPETKTLKCPTCLAEFVVPKDTAMTVCKICGGQLTQI